MMTNQATNPETTLPAFLANCERLQAIGHCKLILPENSWRRDDPPYPDKLCTSYGGWAEVKASTPLDPDRVFVLIERASGGDYSNTCLVERSNYEVLSADCESAGLIDGKDYLRYCGGYGTFALAVRVEVIPEGMIETLEGLEDYPLIDEDDHSRREIESQDAAWEDWGRSDWQRALAKQVRAYFDNGDSSPELLDWIENDWLDSDGMRETADNWFHRACDGANVYWVNESGDSSYSYIDIDCVAEWLFSSIPVEKYPHLAYSAGTQADLQAEIDASVTRQWELAFWQGIACSLRA